MARRQFLPGEREGLIKEADRLMQTPKPELRGHHGDNYRVEEGAVAREERIRSMNRAEERLNAPDRIRVLKREIVQRASRKGELAIQIDKVNKKKEELSNMSTEAGNVYKTKDTESDIEELQRNLRYAQRRRSLIEKLGRIFGVQPARERELAQKLNEAQEKFSSMQKGAWAHENKQAELSRLDREFKNLQNEYGKISDEIEHYQKEVERLENI